MSISRWRGLRRRLRNPRVRKATVAIFDDLVSPCAAGELPSSTPAEIDVPEYLREDELPLLLAMQSDRIAGMCVLAWATEALAGEIESDSETGGRLLRLMSDPRFRAEYDEGLGIACLRPYTWRGRLHRYAGVELARKFRFPRALLDSSSSRASEPEQDHGHLP